VTGFAGLSLNQATVNKLGVTEAADLCVRHDIPAIGLWREHVARAGLAASAARPPAVARASSSSAAAPGLSLNTAAPTAQVLVTRAPRASSRRRHRRSRWAAASAMGWPGSGCAPASRSSSLTDGLLTSTDPLRAEW